MSSEIPACGCETSRPAEYDLHIREGEHYLNEVQISALRIINNGITHMFAEIDCETTWRITAERSYFVATLWFKTGRVMGMVFSLIIMPDAIGTRLSAIAHFYSDDEMQELVSWLIGRCDKFLGVHCVGTQ